MLMEILGNKEKKIDRNPGAVYQNLIEKMLISREVNKKKYEDSQ